MTYYKTADIIGLGLRLDSSNLQLPDNAVITLSVPDLHFDDLILSKKFRAMDANQLTLSTRQGNLIVIQREKDEGSIQDN